MRKIIVTKMQILKSVYENQNVIMNEEQLYSVASENADILINLVNDLYRSTNCHIKSFKDLKTVLIDLYKAYEDYTQVYGDVVIKEPELLRWWNLDKYGYADDHDKFWKLPVITDSDFIPYKTYTEEEYHIVYDILYNDAYKNNAYDVVASYYNGYKTNIGRKVALKHWIKCFQTVIDSLQAWKEKYHEGDVCIYIPFLEDYKETASHVIELFEMAQDASNLLRESNEELVRTENPDALVKIDSMKVIFENWRDRIAQEVGADEAIIIHDEMIRRGLCPNTKVSYTENKYRKYYIGAQEKTLEKNERLSEEEHKEESIKDRAAIIYYMLKDSVDTSTIRKVIHYVCKPTKEFKRADASDTIYTYVYHPEKSFLNKQDRIDNIRETLNKYQFDEEYINKNIK